MFRYPHYSSKRALSSKENWEFAMTVTKWDDAGVAVVVCPIILFIILANILTEVKLRKR